MWNMWRILGVFMAFIWGGFATRDFMDGKPGWLIVMEVAMVPLSLWLGWQLGSPSEDERQ